MSDDEEQNTKVSFEGTTFFDRWIVCNVKETQTTLNYQQSRLGDSLVLTFLSLEHNDLISSLRPKAVPTDAEKTMLVNLLTVDPTALWEQVNNEISKVVGEGYEPTWGGKVQPEDKVTIGYIHRRNGDRVGTINLLPGIDTKLNLPALAYMKRELQIDREDVSDSESRTIESFAKAPGVELRESITPFKADTTSGRG